MLKAPPKDGAKLQRNAEKLATCEAAYMNVKNELEARMRALLTERWDFANAPLLQLLDFQRTHAATQTRLVGGIPASCVLDRVSAPSRAQKTFMAISMRPSHLLRHTLTRGLCLMLRRDSSRAPPSAPKPSPSL